MRKHILVLAALAGFVSLDALAESAGKVLALTGEVTLLRSGLAIKIAQGQALETGDRLKVGDSGNIQVRFTDNSIVMLRPGTEFNIDDYYFQKGEKGRSSFNLVRGGLRTITGVIGKTNRDGYSVKTPTSTIGIRGTHYVLQICNNDCFNRDGSQAPNGVYGAVTDGRIAVTNQSGTTEFGQQEYFRVADTNTAPQPLMAPPSFLAATSVLPLTDTGSGSAPTTLVTSTGGAESLQPASSSSGGGDSAPLVSNSPADTTLASPVLNLPTSTVLVSTNALPGVVSGGGSIALVESGDGNAQSGTYTAAQFASMIQQETGIAGVTTPQALASTGSAIWSGTVQSDPAAGVYWAYQSADTTQVNDYGFHGAWGYAATNLPTSGTATYAYVGSTTPTLKYAGTVYSGTFTGANVLVSFSAMTATVSGNMNWNWAVPSTAAYTVTLGQNSVFSLNGGQTSLVGSSCNPTCSVGIEGAFFGAGGTGAAASFAFNFNNGVAYGGNVVVFKKQ